MDFAQFQKTVETQAQILEQSLALVHKNENMITRLIKETDIKLITITEAKNLTGLSETYLRKLIKAGRIPHITSNKSYMVRFYDLKKFIENELQNNNL